MNNNTPLRGCITLLVVVMAAIGLLGCFAFAHINSVNGELVLQESGLSEQYAIYQTGLDEMITGAFTQAEIAVIAGDQCVEVIGTIISDAISGRYGEGELNLDNATFVAIAEAYPDTSGCDLASLWNQVQSYAADARDAYQDEVVQMRARIQAYGTWRNSDLTRRLVLDIIFRPPTSNLYVTIGDETFRGQEALDKMRIVVTGTRTQDALDSGTFDGSLFPPTEAPR